MFDQQTLQCLYDPLAYEQGVPFELLADLRRHSAVTRVDEHQLAHWPGGDGFWLVLRHAECQHVLKNPSLFSSSTGATQLRNPATQADLLYTQQMMLNMDPPQHSRLRKLLLNSFTSRAVAKLTGQIEQHAVNIIEQHCTRPSGHCDFATDIAADMPLLVLADLFGMPSEDRYLLFDWANRVIGYQDPEYSRSNQFDAAAGSSMAREALKLRPQVDAQGKMPDPRSRDGMRDLYRYAHLLAEHKRRCPGDDIMSILLDQVDSDENGISIEEFENMFWLFAVAGNETVRNGLPGGMLALLQHPQTMHQLRAKPELMPSAIDEMLRWWCPVMIFRRTATANTNLGNANIKRGDKVVVSFVAANRDEGVFNNPNEFNINRTPNPHLSFGYGPHFCLGAQLAKAQMTAIFRTLLNRVDEISLDSEPVYLRSNFQRGIKKLPISWRRTID